MQANAIADVTRILETIPRPGNAQSAVAGAVRLNEAETYAVLSAAGLAVCPHAFLPWRATRDGSC